MITLVTGTPGAGKTLYAVSQLLTQYEKEGRPLFVQGIPDLALDHSVLPIESEWIEHRVIPGNVEGKKAPYFAFPENAVLIIDECQNTFRPRPNGSKVPDIVAALETHRHTGIDFVLITQHPNRIDTAVKTLVGRHLHVRRMFGWNRAIVYEWDSASDPARVNQAMKRNFKYPKKAFKLYKSSTLHTARGNSVPLVFWAAAAAIVAIPFIWYNAFDRTAGKWMGGDKAATEATEPATAQRGETGALPPIIAVDPRLPIIESMQPVDVHDPLSAPIYAEVKPQVVAPVITGCIASNKGCSCYTQQTTTIWLPDEQCRNRAAGKYYDPYQTPPSESRQTPNSQTTAKHQTRPPPEGGLEQI